MEVTTEFLVVTCPTTKNGVFLVSDGSFVTAHPFQSRSAAQLWAFSGSFCTKSHLQAI
jgi:hypothetical protein